MEIVYQGSAQRPTNDQALLGSLAIDGSLDLEQRVNATNDLNRDRRQRNLLLSRGFASSVLLDVRHGEKRTPGMHLMPSSA
jgi:hypothetical protein